MFGPARKYARPGACHTSALVRRFIIALEKLPNIAEFLAFVLKTEELELKKMAEEAVQARAVVLLATMAQTDIIRVPIDVVIVDEASQKKASEAFGGIPFAKILVDLGDRKQLGPRVHSASAARRGDQLSLLELCAR
jgi:superfamily I DNA and/or RNA helicase